MPRCAFLTTTTANQFATCDEPARQAMVSSGWAVDYVPWKACDVSWDQYQLVVIRSTWDYQDEPDAFLRVLEQIDESSARLENGLSVVRWNIKKTYLKDLQTRNIRIVPTCWLTDFDPSRVRELSDELGSEQLVIKPLIGASAIDTYQFSLDPESIRPIADVFRGRPAMVQPFVRTIKTQGELSLFFFGGDYSHSVLKRPAKGDFRVQHEYGGRVEAITPDGDIVEFAQTAIRAIGSDVLYARADIVRLDQAPALMELELVEPALYFEYGPRAAAMFAEAAGGVL